MTTGEYIKSLLKRKHVSITTLSNKMGITSRSTLYRLFRDYYSTEKTVELISEIVKHVNLTDEERCEIEKRIASERVGSFYKQTREILSECYKEDLRGGYTVEADGEEVPLISLLKDHCGGDAQLYIINVDDDRILGDIAELLEWDDRVVVYDYIRLRTHRMRTAYELLTLIRLWKYQNYIPVINESPEYMGLCMVSRRGGVCRYLSVNSDGEYRSFIDTEITDKMYDFVLENNSRLVSRGTDLRCDIKRVSDYIVLLEKNIEFERGGDMYFSEGAPCFGRIPFDIMLEMFEDINYFGFPFEHPYVTKLIEIFRDRAEYETRTLHNRYMLLDKRHVEHMMRTGIAIDHLEDFKPMNKDQLRRYFDCVLGSNGSYARFSFRFIKDDIIRYPFVYNSKGVLYLYARGREGSDSVVFIDKPGIRDIMDDFMGYVWKNETYSDEESRAMLKSMVDEFLS